MDATEHAKKILDILSLAEEKNRDKVKVLNMCLNNFYDFVSGELFSENPFKTKNAYYSELDKVTRKLISSGDSNNQQEFYKAVTSLRALVNKPAPRVKDVA